MTSIGVALIAVGLAVGLVALVALHLLPTELSPIRAAVSQYGITRYRTGYRVQTISYGAAGLGAAIAIRAIPQHTLLPVVLCGIFAATRAAISWFPMDAPGSPPTRSGRRHGLLAVAAFLSVTIAAASLSRALSRDHLDPSIAVLSNALALVMVVTLLSLRLDRRAGGGHFGLIERVFYVEMTVWLIVVAVLAA